MSTTRRLLLCASLAAAATAAEPAHVSMTRPQEVIASHYTKYGHGSTFVELADGKLLHVAGTTFSTSSDRGATWSKTYGCKDTAGNPVGGGGGCLVRLAGNGVGLAAMKQDLSAPTPEEKSWSTHIVFWRSEDGGKTWQPPVRATPPGIQTHILQDVALRTSSGRIVLPVYTAMGQKLGPNNAEVPAVGRLVHNQWVSTNAHFHDARFLASYVVYSDDDGRTWKRNKDGFLYILHDWNSNFDKTAEPSVAEVAPGRLLMILRTSLNRLYQAWSHDNGVTWTRPVPTSLAASETPAQIRRLANGHLLIVWNQEGDEEVRRGLNRTRVSSAISRNGGSVWEFFQNVTTLVPVARVEAGPLRAVRPEQLHFLPGSPAPVRAGPDLGDSDVWIRTSYPSVLVLADRVIVAHTYSRYAEDPVKAELVVPDSFNQIQRVLPLTWFYGGKPPGENPVLKKVTDAATTARP